MQSIVKSNLKNQINNQLLPTLLCIFSLLHFCSRDFYGQWQGYSNPSQARCGAPGSSDMFSNDSVIMWQELDSISPGCWSSLSTSDNASSAEFALDFALNEQLSSDAAHKAIETNLRDTSQELINDCEVRSLDNQIFLSCALTLLLLTSFRYCEHKSASGAVRLTMFFVLDFLH